MYQIIMDNIGKALFGNSSDLKITYPTQSTLQFLSAEQNEDALRGYTCSGLMCYDEAAFLSDKIFDITRPYTFIS